MKERAFDPAKAAKLNDPARLETLVPERMWEALSAPRPRVVVDIGAGTGLVTFEFARLAPQAVVYAVDTSQEMLDWMTERIPADVSDRIEPVKSTEARVPLEDGVADVVTIVLLYHHLADPSAVLLEAGRLLADRGSLLVVDYKKKPTPKGPSLAARVEPEVIARAVAEAGFESVAIVDVLSDFSVITATKPPGAA